MYQRLATLTATTGLTAGIALLLTLGALIPGAALASADDCPAGTAPLIDVNGDPQCVAVDEAPATPDPASPDPTGTPTPTPTELPTPTEEPAEPVSTPEPEPVPATEPESSPAVVVPQPVTVPALPEAPPAETQAPAPDPTPAATPTKSAQIPDKTSDTGTPTPAAVPPEPPADADITGAIVPGDGPRLLWAVAAGASASGLLAAIVALYLVTVRPFLLARRRPDVLG